MKMKKKTQYKALQSIILIGLIVGIGIFLLSFTSSTKWSSVTSTGNYTFDFSGDYGLDTGLATKLGNTSWTLNGGNITAGTNCIDGGCANFVGDIDGKISPSITQFTGGLSMWIKPNSVTGTQFITRSVGAGLVEMGHSVRLVDNTLTITMDGGGSEIESAVGNPIEVGKWTHYYIKANGTTVAVWQNGTKVYSTDTTGKGFWRATASTPYHLGDGSGINMMIDELKWFNVNLTDAQIVDLYNTEKPATPSSSVTNNFPIENYTTVNTSITFNCSAFAPPTYNIINVSLFINNALNYTITGSSNMTSLQVTRTFGTKTNYTWYCQTFTDISDNSVSETRNFTIASFVNNGLTFNSTSYETKRETYTVNITSLTAPTLATFYYNNTPYTATITSVGSNNYLISRTLDIPINRPLFATVNNPLYFQFFLDSAFVNSSSGTQSVDPINASVYGNPYTIPFINFTLYDERTLRKVNGTIGITFNYGLNSILKNFSYSDTNGNTTDFSFAFNPPFNTFTANAEITYSAPGYSTRIYSLPTSSLTNTTTMIPLYLLNTSSSTSFFIKVRDNTYTSIPNANVYIQRYDAGTNTWVTTEIVTTNWEGKALGHFEVETINYRFLVYVNGVLVLTTGSTKVACETAPCTVTLTISSGGGIIKFANLTNFDYSLTYSKTTEIFTYTFTDSSTSAAGGRLRVVRIYGNSTTIEICNNITASASASLTCNVHGLVNGTYVAYAYNTRAVEELVDILQIQKTRNVVASIGVDGLILAVFFIIAIIMLGLFKPALAVLFTIVGVVFVGLIGIISIPYIAIVSIVFIGFIIWWEMRT